MQNNVHTNKEALEKIIAGTKLATNAIRISYGPSGMNAIIACDQPPFNMIANDAQTIVQSIHTHDPLEKIGLNNYKELVEKQNLLSGDGRKTAAIIYDTILTLGKDADIPKMKLKEELDAFIPIIEAKIDEQKRVITVDDIENVATIAGESPKIGKLLGEIYKTIGKDGIIHLENSGTSETSWSFIEGVRFDSAGYLSSAMVHDEEAVKNSLPETKAVYEKPLILVTKRKITHANDINPLLSEMSAQGKKDLVIFTDDMDSGVASQLINAHKEKRYNILIIKNSSIWRNFCFDDFAKCVGATIVEDSTGVNYKNLKLSHLGTCGKIVTDSKETILLGTQDISEHINALKAEGSDDSKLRVSWLTTKTAIVLLGANSESELFYLRLKASDAVNASRLALEDGVVKGGGVCLSHIANEMPATASGRILFEALKSPLMQNLVNMDAVKQLEDKGIYEISFGENVIDASLVTKNAVRYAIAHASTLLTVGIAIPFLPKSEEELRLLSAQTRPQF